VNKSPVIQPQGKHSNKLKKSHFFQNWNTNKIDELKLRQFPNKTVTATVMKKKLSQLKLSLQQ
jgi:hypothetical protein